METPTAAISPIPFRWRPDVSTRPSRANPTMPSAFLSPTHLPQPRSAALLPSRPRRSPVCSIAPPPPPPSRAPGSASPLPRAASRAVAKHHAAAAIRGLSDSAAVATAAEFARDTSTSPLSLPFALALGGLAGVWSAALAVRAVRVHAAHAQSAAKGVAAAWDHWFLYGETARRMAAAEVEGREGGVGVERSAAVAVEGSRDGGSRRKEPQEVEAEAEAEADVRDVVEWMAVLDVLDCSQGAAALGELAESPVVGRRRVLAEALGDVHGAGGSNVVLGVLRSLGEDEEEVVRRAARDALRDIVLRESSPFGVSFPDPSVDEEGEVGEGKRNGEVVSFVDEEEEALVDRDRVVRQMREVLEEAEARERTRHAEELERAAEAERRLRERELVDVPGEHRADLPHGAPALAARQATVLAQRVGEALRVEAPLFDWLANFELRTLCAVVLIPIAFEAASFLEIGGFEFGSGWMRLIGLGWVLSVAGFLAYPASGRIWQRVEKTVVADANAKGNMAPNGGDGQPPPWW